MTNSNDGIPGGERQRAGRPRRRGRRRRGGGGQDAGPPQDAQQGQPEPQQERPREEQPAPRVEPPHAQHQQAAGNRGPRNDRGRRRPNRRPRPLDMGSGEVLRDQGRRTAPIQPMRKRTIVEGDTTEPEFGCPMLTRTRLALPFRGNQQVPRCSVGWAVHDEDEVLFCMHTPSRNLCWKENTEQLEALVEKLRPQIQAELETDGTVAD